MIALFVFAGLVSIGAACTGLLMLLAVNVGPRCPACRGDALLIRTPILGRLAPWLERRWCLDCGWHGLTRQGSRTPIEPTAVDVGRPKPV